MVVRLLHGGLYRSSTSLSCMNTQVVDAVLLLYMRILLYSCSDCGPQKTSETADTRTTNFEIQYVTASFVDDKLERISSQVHATSQLRNTLLVKRILIRRIC